jgi:maltose alpha-D-glucosyltransferase/alpha-amylase
MQWAPGPQAGFSTADPKQFYLPLDPDPVRPDVADEEKDPNSLLNFTRALLKLRAGNASLGNLGHFKPLFAESHKYPFVYLRSGGPDQFLIAINPSHSIQSCALPAMNAATPVIDSGTVLSGATLTMQPVSYAIYKVAGTN